jgi:hypothetical protein
MQLSHSNGNAPLLTLKLLTRLEEAWAAQGALIAGNDTPGLSDDEMDEITAALGLSLPLEARVWWGWHDGVPWRPSGEPTPERELGPGIQYLPLRDAVADYLMDRQIFTDLEGDAEPFRPAAYFPITRTSGPVLCDCSVPAGAPSPIYYTHTYGNPLEELAQPGARSFGEMVSWWIDALSDGIWRWDATREAWDYDWERLDPKRELSGLV